MLCVVLGRITVAPTVPLDLQARFDGDPSGHRRLLEQLVVPLVLVCIRLGEVSEGPVERGSAPQVAGDRNAVSRTSVGTGKGLSTDADVLGESRRDRFFDLEAPLPGSELADVEVPGNSVRTFDRLVAEEDVAGGDRFVSSNRQPDPGIASGAAP